ncbi:MAG: type II toxin-antitoxin system VapC family toxin [Gemmatimonadales bacterium]
MTRYVLDTNLYIEANHDAQHAKELTRFVAGALPFLYLSAVVVQELLAGARTKDDAQGLEDDVIGPFERVGRLVTPSYRTFKRAGQVLGDLVRGGLVLGRAERGFVNDLLLAISCIEHGCTLVTRNERDFARISQHLTGFAFAAPYP